MSDVFLWGFLVFAVPNVVGCAAFGYVVRNRSRSQAMIARHSGAMRVFSSVTVAYHMFFIVWLFDAVLPGAQTSALATLTAAFLLFVIGFALSNLADRSWQFLSIIVYAISLGAFWKVGGEAFSHIPWFGTHERTQLFMLLPMFAFGFLLCPYLDFTFHRAIRNSPSRHSFAVFGLTFAIMIVLSIAIWRWPTFLQENWLPAIVIAHLLAQSVFTVGAHMRELRQQVASGTRFLLVAPLLASLLLYAGRMFTDSHQLGENLYIAFLSLYGTLFPAWFILGQMKRKTPSA
jgi:hypothetical protein